MANWDDTMLVGVPKIDAEHKDIVARVNEFLDALDNGASVLAMHDCFRRMEHSIHRHLYNEEEMLKRLGYPLAETHGDEHDQLLAQLADIWNNMLSNKNFAPGAAARTWLDNWISQHLQEHDVPYRDWLRAEGLTERANQEMPD